MLTQVAGSRWRYRGRTPAHGDFQADLWRGVLSQFVVEDTEGVPCGLVGAYNANTTAGHCHIFAAASADRGAVVTEAAAMLVNWLFDEFDFHKLWIEAAEFNLAQFASLRESAAVEGRLTSFDFWKGRFWDLLILSISRAAWDERHRPMIEAALGRSGHHESRAAQSPSWPDLLVMLDDHLPLDSLSAAEVLMQLEERLDRPLDPSILSDLNGLTPEAAATIVQERLERID